MCHDVVANRVVGFVVALSQQQQLLLQQQQTKDLHLDAQTEVRFRAGTTRWRLFSAFERARFVKPIGAFAGSSYQSSYMSSYVSSYQVRWRHFCS